MERVGKCTLIAYSHIEGRAELDFCQVYMLTCPACKTFPFESSFKRRWESDFPRGPSGYESACQCSVHVFNPWSRKIPHAEVQLKPCATTSEPVLQSPQAAIREATTHRSLHVSMKSSPHSLQLEEVSMQQ